MKNNLGEDKNKASEFWDQKASLVAGLILIIEICKNLLELFIHELPTWFRFTILFVVIIITVLILGTKKLDRFLLSIDGLGKCGAYLTGCSILIYIMDNLLEESKLNTVSKLCFFFVSLVIVISAMYLLFKKNNIKN